MTRPRQAWAGSARAAQLPPNWKTLRALVIRRDRGRCQHRAHPDAVICGAHGTDVDHIQRGDDHSPANLQLLCTAHHAAKSSREGHAAQIPRRRPPERHPALG